MTDEVKNEIVEEQTDDAAEQQVVEEQQPVEVVEAAEEIEADDDSDQADEAVQAEEELEAKEDETAEAEDIDDAGEGEDTEAASEGDETQDAKAPFGVHEDGVEPTVESVVEAILFASDEPITAGRLVDIVEVGGVKEIKEAVEKLNEKYRHMNSAFRVEEIAGGLQMMTLSNYNHWLKKLIRVRGDTKLTQAALETLAIVAYKQPIIRADVEAIRGVGSGEMIRSLMYKGLVKIAGRAEVLGRPLMYGTTKKFLEVFGLGSLKDLPKIEELKRPE